MITDVPQADDLRRYGCDLLNLAWDNAIDLQTYLDNANFGAEVRLPEDDPDSVTDEYWAAAQRPLSIAAAVAQQGTEFLLKARIADVSPFLLLAGDPPSWPAKCQTNDTPFSAFKTIAAVDLVRVHDTLATSRLPPTFVERFNGLREQRNAILHSIPQLKRFTTADILLDILESVDALIGPKKWNKIRLEYLYQHPEIVATGEYAEDVFVWQSVKVFELLKPSQLARHFNFDKDARRYICPLCERSVEDAEIHARTAQLAPNLPSSTTVACAVCERTSSVSREDCKREGCKGNVMSSDQLCLTCGQAQPRK